MTVTADKDKCLRCGGCVGVCPVTALHLGEHGIACSGKCTNCGICVQFSPVGALRLAQAKPAPVGLKK
jgi:ferredoxin